MAESFTLIREDRFGEALALIESPDQVETLDEGQRPQVTVRRPLTGIEHKKDKYAILRVVQSSGTKIRIHNNSAPASKKRLLTALKEGQDLTSSQSTYNSNLMI